jgi:hypothetical protein
VLFCLARLAKKNAVSKQIYIGGFHNLFGFFHLLWRGNPFFSSAILAAKEE